MPDLDQLLGSDVAGPASRSVRPPEFDELAGRGRRRRLRRRSALASVVAVVVVAGSAALVDQGTHRDSAPDPAPPSPTPTGIPSPDEDGGPTPTEVVDDPASEVKQVVAAPSDPDVRAAVWHLCANKGGGESDVAIALSTDGFASRTVVGLHRHDGGIPLVTAAGRDAFVVSYDERHPYLLRTDGRTSPIPRPRTTTPLQPGEVVANWKGSGDPDVMGVAPTTGEAHWIPVPDGSHGILGGSRHLQGIAVEAGRWRAIWSDDGGATWREHRFQDARQLYSMARSAEPGTMAAIEGGDGATLLPLDAVHRATRDGADWERIPEGHDPLAYVGVSVVLPDGRLMVEVQGWSDRANDPKYGLYLSDGEDWSRMRWVPPPAATGLRVGSGELYVVGMSVQRGGAALYVTSPGDVGSVFRVVPESSGGELTWTPLPAR